jgi:hypothetical protein
MVKKILFTSALLMGMAMLCSVLSVGIDVGRAEAFEYGDGTVGNPYQIATAEQLDDVRSHLEAHFKLTADIDLTAYLSEGGDGHNDGEGWEPIGDPLGTSFTGTFDGNGYSISGLFIYRVEGYSELAVGLFGRVVNATIQNVTLLDLDVTGYQEEGYIYVGGLVGLNIEGTISGCKTAGDVCGNMNVGGLVGRNDFGTITGSHAVVDVFGGSGKMFGGLVGDNNGGTISDSYAMGDVFGGSDSGNVGGLVGTTACGTIENSYATGSVSGLRYVGGLAGENYENEIRKSYAAGTVTGERYVGGLVGKNTCQGGPDAILRNVYAKGAVSGIEYVGGLVGINAGSSAAIDKSYAVGAVAGKTDVGGLVGTNYYYGSTGSITDSYYDQETSGQNDTGKGIPKSTVEMKQQATFIDWDFTNTWSIYEGLSYPFLGWQTMTMINYVAGPGGSVSPTSEFLDSATGTPLGSIATTDPGYVFVNWTDGEGVEVGTAVHFVPEKVDGCYEDAIYYANFARGAKPKEPGNPEKPGKPDKLPKPPRK